VKKIFTDCGYSAESPKIIETARSEKLEVDVFVEIDSIPKQIIICECKNWNVNIPQAVVHSFRMQVNDSGANLGLLISKNGFQSGAIEASRFSNVKLLTWHEFEEIYERIWYKNYFVPKLYTLSGPLVEYTEPVNYRIFRKADLLSKDKQVRFRELRTKYEQQATFISLLSTNSALLCKGRTTNETLLTLPISSNQTFIDNKCFPDSILNCSSYEEFLSELTSYISEAVSEFDNLFGERA